MKNAFKEKLKQNKCELIFMAVVIALYFFNKLVLINYTTGVANYFFRCYFNDLICPVFFLSYCKVLFSVLKLKFENFFLFLGIGMAAGFFWELVTPLINHNAVSDPYDLLCYFAGIHVYYLIHRMSSTHNSQEYGARQVGSRFC